MEDIDKMIRVANENGIYSVWGPNWDRNLRMIYEKISDETGRLYESCAEGAQAMSFKTLQHWFQNKVT